MIEGFAREMSEESMLQAILFGHEQVVKIIGRVDVVWNKVVHLAVGEVALLLTLVH